VLADGGHEAHRLSPEGDEHPFGGLAVQGTREQVVAAAWLIEEEGLMCKAIQPLRRRPKRSSR
jgi:hypothetical protein